MRASTLRHLFLVLRAFNLQIGNRQLISHQTNQHLVAMTYSDVLNIVVTVGVCQICLDLACNYLVYKKDPYQRACSALERASWKLKKGK